MSNESTAVATREQTGAVSPAREEARLAFQKATMLAKSTMIPQAFQGNVENCLIALEYANRLGCSELAVMQNLDVVRGRPSLRATFLIGTVNASGRFTPVRFRWQGEEGSDGWGCRAVARDRENGEECVGPLITIGLAKAEGWYSKKDKYGNETSKWQTIPELMLGYRAAAWWTRLYCPELSLGLHTTDEAEDMGYAEPVRPTPQQHAERVAAALASTEPEKPDPEKPDYEVVEEGPADERLEKQRKTYHAMLAERGMSADADRHAFQARLFEHALVGAASTKDWKVADYIGAIEELKEIPVVETVTA